MEYVTLRNGFKLPMIGFGTYPLRGKELENILQMTSEAGYQLYDSAHLYKNEEDIGNCISKGVLCRKDIILTSKIQGIQFTGRRRYFYLDQKSVKKAYIEACQKFCTDHLDLLLLHSPFKGYIKAYKELMQLYNEGKVNVIGVSNFDTEELKTLYQNCGEYPMINQIEMHPYNTMKPVVTFCKEQGIQVEAYSPFGRGNLLSEILNNPRLNEIAKRHNKTVGQIVLRWIVQQGIVVIPRSTNAERIRQNLDVFNFFLSNDEMTYIDSLNQNKGFGAHFQH